MKLCLIFNDASIYRETIYNMIDQEYDCDWYFEESSTDIKEMNLSLLKSVHKYQSWGNPSKIYWQKGIISLLFKKEYKIFFMLLESRCLSTWAFLLFRRLFYKDKRIYVWSHGWYGKENKLEISLKKWMFRLVDESFLYGQYAKDIMISHGFDESKIHVIHNSLAYDKQLSIRNSLSESSIYKDYFGNEYPILAMIGRLNVRKHLDMLFYAVSNLNKQGLNFNIVLIGDGPDRYRLESISKELNLEKFVWFYGSCYDEMKNAELLFNSDLTVVPGDIGLTAIHSLMFGVPVISHNTFKHQGPEFEVIVPGETGDFYDYGSVESLASRIKEWFAQNQGRRDLVRECCYKLIDQEWTPAYQMKVIKRYINENTDN